MKPEDLKIESYPDRKPGGQVVGIMTTGIRVTHLPTNLVASCEAQRSQTKNRVVALAMIEYGLVELGWREEA